MTKTTATHLPNLSMADQKAFSVMSEHLGGFLKEHSSKSKAKNVRKLDPEAFEEIFAVSGRLSRLSTHLPTLNEERGRTGQNYLKRNSKGKPIKGEWALDTPAVCVWTKEAFADLRAKALKESGYTRPPAELLYVLPWSDVPQEVRKSLQEGESYENYRGDTVKIPHKFRRPYKETDPVFKPQAVALLIRRKKGQDWLAPQWLVLGTYGRKGKDRVPAVMPQALIWERSCIPELAQVIGAPETAIPSIFKDEEPDEPKKSTKKHKNDTTFDIDDIGW